MVHLRESAEINLWFTVIDIGSWPHFGQGSPPLLVPAPRNSTARWPEGSVRFHTRWLSARQPVETHLHLLYAHPEIELLDTLVAAEVIDDPDKW